MIGLPSRVDRRSVWLVALAGLNVGLSLPIVASLPDWRFDDLTIFSTAGQRISSGLNPYADGTFLYSPVVAIAASGLAAIGPVGWTLLAFALVAALRDPRLIAAFLLSWSFWVDVSTGLSFLPLPVLAILALRGSRAGAVALFALAFLVPRPAAAPIIAWLVWHDRSLVRPLVVVGVALGLGALVTGWADEWLGRLATLGEEPAGGRLAVAELLGPLWVLALPLSVLLTLRGNLGFAALAISPYWTAAYPMLVILELDTRWRGSSVTTSAGRAMRTPDPAAIQPE